MVRGVVESSSSLEKEGEMRRRVHGRSRRRASLDPLNDTLQQQLQRRKGTMFETKWHHRLVRMAPTISENILLTKTGNGRITRSALCAPASSFGGGERRQVLAGGRP